MRIDIVGFKSQSFAKACDGVVPFALREKGVGKVVVGLDIVEIETKCLLVTAHRLLNTALLLEGHAEVVVSFRVIGLEAENVLIPGHRLAEISGLVVPDGFLKSLSNAGHGFLHPCAGQHHVGLTPRRSPWRRYSMAVIIAS